LRANIGIGQKKNKKRKFERARIVSWNSEDQKERDLSIETTFLHSITQIIFCHCPKIAEIKREKVEGGERLMMEKSLFSKRNKSRKQPRKN